MNENDPKSLVEIVEEQDWNEILSVLDNAIETQSEVELTVLSLYGKQHRTAIAVPLSIEKDVLKLTTQNGCEMAIELSRIKRAVKIK